MAGMRMAKADNDDFETTHNFLQACEMFWDNRNRYSLKETECEWHELDDDDEDKIELIRIRRMLADEEGVSEKRIDNRLVIYEFIKRKYKQCDCNWRRVTFGAQILIDSVCDPQKDYLDYSPYLEQQATDREQ